MLVFMANDFGQTKPIRWLHQVSKEIELQARAFVFVDGKRRPLLGLEVPNERRCSSGSSCRLFDTVRDNTDRFGSNKCHKVDKLG